MAKDESANQQIGSGTTLPKATLKFIQNGVPTWPLVRTGRVFCAFPW